MRNSLRNQQSASPPPCSLSYRHPAISVSRYDKREYSLSGPAPGIRSTSGLMYLVHFENSGQAVEMSGSQLRQIDISVRLDEDLTSEMLIFEAK